MVHMAPQSLNRKSGKINDLRDFFFQVVMEVVTDFITHT
jgi:hypothetical protein